AASHGMGGSMGGGGHSMGSVGHSMGSVGRSMGPTSFSRPMSAGAINRPSFSRPMSAGAINRPIRPGMASTMVNRPFTRTVTGANWNNNWGWHRHHRRFFPFAVGVGFGLGLGYDYGYNSCWACDGWQWVYVCDYPCGPYGLCGYGYLHRLLV